MNDAMKLEIEAITEYYIAKANNKVKGLSYEYFLYRRNANRPIINLNSGEYDAGWFNIIIEHLEKKYGEKLSIADVKRAFSKLYEYSNSYKEYQDYGYDELIEDLLDDNLGMLEAYKNMHLNRIDWQFKKSKDTLSNKEMAYVNYLLLSICEGMGIINKSVGMNTMIWGTYIIELAKLKKIGKRSGLKYDYKKNYFKLILERLTARDVYNLFGGCTPAYSTWSNTPLKYVQSMKNEKVVQEFSENKKNRVEEVAAMQALYRIMHNDLISNEEYLEIVQIV